MQWSWRTLTLALCSCGFLKEIRPITPFLTPYLIENKNISNVDLYGQVFPVWTYSYLACLVPVFVLTDLLRYKPVIVCESLAYVGTWILLIWAEGVLAMQCMQALYGLATAT